MHLDTTNILRVPRGEKARRVHHIAFACHWKWFIECKFGIWLKYYISRCCSESIFLDSSLTHLVRKSQISFGELVCYRFSQGKHTHKQQSGHNAMTTSKRNKIQTIASNIEWISLDEMEKDATRTTMASLLATHEIQLPNYGREDTITEFTIFITNKFVAQSTRKSVQQLCRISIWCFTFS